jgi:hypothetical protein
MSPSSRSDGSCYGAASVIAAVPASPPHACRRDAAIIIGASVKFQAARLITPWDEHLTAKG